MKKKIAKRIKVRQGIAKFYLTLCAVPVVSALVAAEIVFYPEFDMGTAMVGGFFMLLWSADTVFEIRIGF